MLGLVFNILIVAGLAMLVLWGLYALAVKYWPTATTTSAGQAVAKVVDTTQQISVKAALWALREYDPIQNDPQAIVAWNYLWGVAVAGKPPAATVASLPVVYVEAAKPAEVPKPTTAEVTGGVETVTFE